MTTPTWPASIPWRTPQMPSEAVQDTTLRVPTSTGPGRQRRRSLDAARFLSATLTMTRAEFTVFMSFYNAELSNGSKEFKMADPFIAPDPNDATANVATYTFEAAPTYVALSGDGGGGASVLNVSLSLRRRL